MRRRGERERWEIPATPRLICSGAHLYVSPPLSSRLPSSSSVRGIYFSGACASCTFARARVFVIPTCFMPRAVLYLHVAIASVQDEDDREWWWRGKGEGRARGRGRGIGGDHPEIASAFLIRAFLHTMISRGCLSRSSFHHSSRLVL